MNLISKINTEKVLFISILVSLMPFSFIAGNMILSINTILIVLSSIILFGKDVFRIKIYLLDKILFIFFILIIITGVINNFQLYPIYKTWSLTVDMSAYQYFPIIISQFFFKIFITLRCP